MIKRKPIQIIFFAPFLFAILLGCADPTTEETSETANSNLGYPAYPAYPGQVSENARLDINSTRVVEVSTPQPKQATITGIVISERTDAPIVEIPVQLAEVYYEGDRGAFVLDVAQSPTTTTDGNGRFAFVDIEARDYVLVIGNVEINDYEIVPDESGKVRIWSAPAGEVLDTGLHQVLLDRWE